MSTQWSPGLDSGTICRRRRHIKGTRRADYGERTRGVLERLAPWYLEFGKTTFRVIHWCEEEQKNHKDGTDCPNAGGRNLGLVFHDAASPQTTGGQRSVRVLWARKEKGTTPKDECGPRASVQRGSQDPRLSLENELLSRRTSQLATKVKGGSA